MCSRWVRGGGRGHPHAVRREAFKPGRVARQAGCRQQQLQPPHVIQRLHRRRLCGPLARRGGEGPQPSGEPPQRRRLRLAGLRLCLRAPPRRQLSSTACCIQHTASAAIAAAIPSLEGAPPVWVCMQKSCATQKRGCSRRSDGRHPRLHLCNTLHLSHGRNANGGRLIPGAACCKHRCFPKQVP